MISENYQQWKKPRIGKRLIATSLVVILIMSVLMISLPVHAADAQNIIVVSTAPENGDHDIAPDSNIVVVFDSIVDFTSVTSSSFQVNGTESGVISGEFTGEGTDTVVFNPNSDFAYGEAISVTLTTEIRNTMMMPLSSENNWSFTVAEEHIILPLPETSTLILAGGGLVILLLFLFYRLKRLPTG